MGYPEPVAVSGSTYSEIAPVLAAREGKQFDVEDLACGLVKFAGGATLIVESSWAVNLEPSETIAVNLCGDKGGLSYRHGSGGWFAEVYSDEGGDLYTKKLDRRTGPAPSAYSDFVDSILEDRPPLATGGPRPQGDEDHRGDLPQRQDRQGGPLPGRGNGMTGTTDFPAEEILQLTPQAGSWLRGEAESRGQSAAEVLGSLVEERAASAHASPLSPDQVEQYRRDGYLLVSGLIPDDAAARAEEAMWRCIGCDPENPPPSWEVVPGDLRLYNDPDLKNCFTPDLLAAAAQITGDDLSTFSKSDTHPKTWHTATYLEAEASGEDLSRFYRWDCAYAINIMPGKGDGGTTRTSITRWAATTTEPSRRCSGSEP